MTREYRERVICPHCGGVVSTETAFSQWVRAQPELDSKRDGIVLNDIDFIVHKYHQHSDKCGTRLVEMMMVVELKCHGAEPTDQQIDTLGIFHQLVQNRRKTPTKPKVGMRAQEQKRLVKAYSYMKRTEVPVWCFGAHFLILSGTTPDDSDVITWDGAEITREQVIRLLKFELDPFDPTIELSLRRHHKATMMPLFDACDVPMASKELC